MKLEGEWNKQVEPAACNAETEDAFKAACTEVDEKDMDKVASGIQLGTQYDSYNFVGGKTPLTLAQLDGLDAFSQSYHIEDHLFSMRLADKADMNAQTWLQGRGQKGTVLY